MGGAKVQNGSRRLPGCWLRWLQCSMRSVTGCALGKSSPTLPDGPQKPQSRQAKATILLIVLFKGKTVLPGAFFVLSLPFLLGFEGSMHFPV